jgi:hypothetical protein
MPAPAPGPGPGGPGGPPASTDIRSTLAHTHTRLTWIGSHSRTSHRSHTGPNHRRHARSYQRRSAVPTTIIAWSHSSGCPIRWSSPTGRSIPWCSASARRSAPLHWCFAYPDTRCLATTALLGESRRVLSFERITQLCHTWHLGVVQLVCTRKYLDRLLLRQPNNIRYENQHIPKSG